MTITDNTTAQRFPKRSSRRRFNAQLSLLIITGAQLMVVLDSTIVNVALPAMGTYFHKSQTDMTWTLSAYTLAFGGLLLLGGRSGDILGRRRMFIVGLSLFTAGSFLAGIATSFPMMLVGRVVQGVGGAIAAPTALSLIANEFKEGAERTRALAVYAAVSGAGAALGLLLGGILTNFVSWRWVLFVNVPIGLVLIAGARSRLRETERLQGRFDLVGAFLSMGAVVSLVYGFIHVAHTSWGNPETWALFTSSALLLLAFVLVEARIAAPMMPLRIFSNTSRSGAYLVMLVVGAALFGQFFFVTFFVQQVRGFSALETGFAFLPVAIVIGITSQVASRLLARVGPKRLIVAGTMTLAVALFWLSTVDAESSYPAVLLPGILVMAVGLGLLFVPLTTVAVSKIARTDTGLASALLNVGQQVGGAIGLSVLATVSTTASKGFAGGHEASLRAAVGTLPAPAQPLVAARLSSSSRNPVRPADVATLVNRLPVDEQAPVAHFFQGPYLDFSHQAQAQGAGSAFLAAAIFALVAVVVGSVMIRVTKRDVRAAAPSDESIVDAQ